MNIQDSIEFRGALYNSLCLLEPKYRKEILDGLVYAYHRLPKIETETTYERGLMEGTLLSILHLFNYDSQRVLDVVDYYNEAKEFILLIEGEVGSNEYSDIDIPELCNLLKLGKETKNKNGKQSK